MNNTSSGDRLQQILVTAGVSDDVAAQLRSAIEVYSAEWMIIELCDALETCVDTKAQLSHQANVRVDWYKIFGTSSSTATRLERLQLNTYGILQMHSYKELGENIRWIGPTKTRPIVTMLAVAGLRFRYWKEPFAERANEIYGGVDRVPVAAVMSSFDFSPGWHWYLDRIQLRTIGDVRRADRDALHKSAYREERSILNALFLMTTDEELAKR